MGFLGMNLNRAIDGRPTIWKILEQYFSYPARSSAFFRPLRRKASGSSSDTRETGYQVRYMARMAALDPDPGWQANTHARICTMWWRIFLPSCTGFSWASGK